MSPQDLVALTPALVIVLGADVGTALMARILTFDLSWLSPLLIFIGVIFFLGRKQSPRRAAGSRRYRAWPDSTGAGADCAGSDADNSG
ncbi:Sodium-dependent phosphate transporter [Salmonella enterica subsp. enterica]|uniref:Sodium-dependent phosphate transporter n=1 Tax=Salmonella enterica I TaxID=59201 RepID=A0A447TQ57_SALET|nr:Sodium-dependent phosphate transporter [Salmonella enterica subsp. enterica]